MKQQINEIRRMQQLAGLIKESQLNEEFTPMAHDAEDDDAYGGKVLDSWSAPMEGWDENHQDYVVIVKKDDGFYVDGYLAFGDFDAEGPFATHEEAKQKAQEIMDDIVSSWDEE